MVTIVAQMKMKRILNILLLTVLLSRVGFSQVQYYPRLSSTGEKYLSLTPDLKDATLKDDIVRIPFTVKNNYTEGIVIPRPFSIDGLMTLDDPGTKVFIDNYETGRQGRIGGGPLDQTILKPGESREYESVSYMKTLAFVLKKNKKIFGAIQGYVAGSNQPFESYSEPFPVPAALATPPWVDLGEQEYFSVKPDLTKATVDDGVIIAGGSILFPVKITNTTAQPYIAATDTVSFYIVRDTSKKNPPSPWETIKTSMPVLKPGESAISTGRCYITFNDLKSQGYKEGDKIVAAVGGRLPNTNQIFESYSAPFELPPLPMSPPK